MYRSLKRCWIAVFLCILLAGCSPAAATPLPATSAVAPEAAPTIGGTVVNASGITSDKPGEVLHLKVGDTFEVRIPTIPMSGFTWQPMNLDTGVLTQLGDPVYEPAPGPNAAGGTVVIGFKVVGAGTVPLTLIYAGGSNSGGPMLYNQSFGLTVDAK